MWELVSSPFYRWENWGPKRESLSPKVLQLEKWQNWGCNLSTWFLTVKTQHYRDVETLAQRVKRLEDSNHVWLSIVECRHLHGPSCLYLPSSQKPALVAAGQRDRNQPWVSPLEFHESIIGRTDIYMAATVQDTLTYVTIKGTLILQRKKQVHRG